MIIIDLEWTCCNNNEFDQEKDGEIIEIGAVRVNDDFSEIESTFQAFVKPVQNPELTEFAKKLLHISQEMVDEAETFDKVWPKFLEWLGEDDSFGSWGGCDLVRIVRECKLHDLKQPFVKHSNIARILRPRMANMRKHKIKWQGERHRAISDAMTYAKIAIAIKPKKLNYRMVK
jgi:inhibitor of KinA sporulation pathway (predicted exonuclease)